MLLFLRVDVNIMAGIVTTVVLIIAVRDFDRSVRLNRLFCRLLFAIVLVLILETLSCVADKSLEIQSVPLSLALNTLTFLDAPLIVILWVLFVLAWTYPDRAFSAWVKGLFLLPLGIDVLLFLLNLKYGFIFSISPEDVYCRGSYFWLSYLIPYLYMLPSVALLLRKRKELHRGEMAPFAWFLVICGIGSCLQGLLYGTLLMWSTMAFSTLFLFIFMQQNQMRYDMMTGAWTKETVQRYIHQHVRRGRKVQIGVVFIDLDNFKSINDTYGHMEGDRALRTSVELIQRALRSTDIVARFGGDEFILLIDSATDAGLQIIIQKIERNFEEYNRSSDKDYALEYSFGFALFDPQKQNINELLERVDEMMYTDKQSKRHTRTI